MSIFLNKEAICREILSLIDNAQQELIIIVPYIKLSVSTFEHLKQADERGVQTNLIYRKNLIDGDQQRLSFFKNLNLLSHSNVHAKCYVNESKMIVTSMNLYDYSERYNREMGILIDRHQDPEAFREALKECKSIIQSANMDKKSLRVHKNGFDPQVLNLFDDNQGKSSSQIDAVFDNKKFFLAEGRYVCTQYYDYIDVTIEPTLNDGSEDEGDIDIHRVKLRFNWDDELLARVFSRFSQTYSENMFPNFKIYWSYYKSTLMIYRSGKNLPKWNRLSRSESLIKFRDGISMAAIFVQNIERSLRWQEVTR